jgi:hypothetical protein
MTSSAQASQVSSSAQLGWRFGIGVILVIGGYIPLGFLPIVAGADMSLVLKTVLTGFIGGMPLLSKLVAIAVMGRPGFNFLKERVFHSSSRLLPTRHVSRLRYRIGLVLFLLPLLFSTFEPYAPGLLVDWSETRVLWSLIGDSLLVISLFVLGAGFWEKLRALFIYDAEVGVP